VQRGRLGEDDLQIVCRFYQDDFSVENLKTFGLHFKQYYEHPT